GLSACRVVFSPRRRRPRCVLLPYTTLFRSWALDDDERLLLVVLGQRYLLYEEEPRPLSYAVAAKQLAYLRPDGNWTERRIEHRIDRKSTRLNSSHVKTSYAVFCSKKKRQRA